MSRWTTSMLAVAWMLAAPPLNHPESPGFRQQAAIELRGLLASSIHSDLRWPEFSAYRTQVATFYTNLGYTLAWTHDGLPGAVSRTVIEALIASDSKGLDPEDYDGPRWSARLLELHKRAASPRDLARFDLSLTISAMRYVSDLCTGKVIPKLVHPGFRLTHESPDPETFLRQCVLTAKDPHLILESLEPRFDGYRRTKEALQLYRELAGRDTHRPLPRLSKTLKPGDSYSGIKRLTELLQLLGDLPEDAVVPAELNIYQGRVVEAVKKFQGRHGLNPNGHIDSGTLVELETPLSRRVRQLQLTLERWRWVPHSFSRPPIVVNIPEFSLRGLSDSYLTELDMKVVVGKAFRHRTPVFAGNLTHVIFRPYWNVPLSIVRSEFLPAIERKASAEAYRDFQIVRPDGTVATDRKVSDHTLTLLRKGQLRIRQLPGPQNALGLVKFIFPNDNNVYLHDTPAQRLFLQARRDFSHGCIRVEKPRVLAEWVLRNNPEWTPARIEAAMNGASTTQANVNPAIPVLIVYATAVAHPGGQVRFFNDIYGHDATLDKQLRQPHP